MLFKIGCILMFLSLGYLAFCQLNMVINSPVEPLVITND